jgi:hypothetical protein
VRTRVTLAVAAALALLAWLAAPVLGGSPQRLTSEITKHASSLANWRGDLRAAVENLYGQDPSKFYVISVSALNPDITHRNDAQPAPAPATGLSGASQVAIILGAAILLLGLALLVSRRMWKSGSGSTAAGPGPPPRLKSEELQAQTSQALIQTDDAIRTSDQELGFVTARFGEHAVAPFAAVLKSARLELGEAFRLRQLLDDGGGGSDPTRRQYLTQLAAHCAAASQLLDEQSEAFDRLQDLEARAPQVLAEVEAHAAQQSARVRHSGDLLVHLTAKYTAPAVAMVTSNPDEADRRLRFAGGCVAAARTALADQQTGAAAVLLQAAESAADQASDLLNGVEHLEAELTQAASALPAALREIDADIAEAAALLASRPADELASLVASAETVAGQTRAQVTDGPFDALAALRGVEQADAALHHALTSAREEPTRQDRARALLDQAMLVARSSVTAADDFITTRRGGVGAPARTRLAEAQRHFRQAIGSAQHDPGAALSEADHADALAQQASSLAEEDIGWFGDGQLGHAGDRAFGSAVLGGILIDSLPHGNGSDPSQAGLDEDEDGGEYRSGGLVGPGSFGGVGTRGRRSISYGPVSGPAPDGPGTEDPATLSR